MLQPVARIGDITVGCCAIHGPQMGQIISGKPDTLVGMIPESTITDLVMANCGDIGQIITGNYTLLDHMLPVARIGDQFVGVYSGSIVTGAYDTLA